MEIQLCSVTGRDWRIALAGCTALGYAQGCNHTLLPCGLHKNSVCICEHCVGGPVPGCRCKLKEYASLEVGIGT